ncbi:MAG TPA: RDD family protein [Thermoanaerobaculia bacterium]|jgi:uncharacterized RDD family membrane protein YckC|nr:RDD family protein [Thermoanaerobaculia bacterium]
MRRPGKPNDPEEEPLLFDLPLSAPGSREEPDELPVTPKRSLPEARRPAPAPAATPIAPARAGRSGPVPVPATEVEEDAEPARAASEFAGSGKRLAAGLADLVVHAAIAVLALLGCRGLGVRPDLREVPAFAAFLLSFSFLYTVLPLAFWGHTPGMAWAGITSHKPPQNGEPLTFDQTVRRWLGAILTSALAGLPLLLAFGGRTLTDWVSGSATYPLDDEDGE